MRAEGNDRLVWWKRPLGKTSDGVTIGLVETMDDLAASDRVTVEVF
ncbi:MAG TPA: hypothetical protein VGL76_12310 [Gaiellaceae bacterium]